MNQSLNFSFINFIFTSMQPYFWLLFLCASEQCFAETANGQAHNEDNGPEGTKHGKQVGKPAKRGYGMIIPGSYGSGHDTVDHKSSSVVDSDSSPYEYYTSSEEESNTSTGSTDTTVSTTFSQAVSMKLTTSLTPIWTTKQRDTAGQWNDTLEDNLTAEAWAELPNKEELEMDAKRVKEKWSWIYHQRLYPEYYHNIKPYGTNAGVLIRCCYQIGTTYYAARGDLREYYKIRYMYHNEKEYEIGYVVHEIVHKYTVLLEMYHIVQYKYYNQSKFSDIMTTTAMLYMYTNILEISHQIVHLCNALHEIEKKYEHVEKMYSLKNMHEDGNDMYKKFDVSGETFKGDYLKEAEMARQKRMRIRKKIRKEHKKMLKIGAFSSTKRTRKPRTYGRFPHHYGWSIEYW